MPIALGRKLAIPNPLRDVVGGAEEVVLVDEVVLGTQNSSRLELLQPMRRKTFLK